MKGNFHVWCEVGENLEITSKSYLSLCYQIAKKKKLTGAKKVAYIAGYVAVNSINPFKVAKKAIKCVKTVKKVKFVSKIAKKIKKAKPLLKKTKKISLKKKNPSKIKKYLNKVKNSSTYKKVKCKITKKGCFVEGTLVLTENGLIPIEDIEVGDYVWSENPKTGEIELKEVLNTFEKQVDTIVTITVNGENIETTEAHLFYVENVGWVPASMLREGDILSLEDGRELPIQSIETTIYNHYINVYNFEVDDFHTYYVSNINILTHNNGGCDGDASNKKKGRTGKQAKLREMAEDDKLPRYLRGEIIRDINHIERDKRKKRGKKRRTIRVPFGYQMAHKRGYEARKGYGYTYSQLNTISDHKRQHKFDNNGKKR